MIARFKISVLLAVAALLLGAGCSGGDRATFSAETDESAYQDGQRAKSAGRNNEALSDFLRVIAKRGEQGAPESHLDAGLIYAQHIKDPIAAIYHFRKYLELRPNAANSDKVRDRIENAKREFVRQVPGKLLDTETERMELQDQVDRLKRENDLLRAELDSLHLTAPGSFIRGLRPPAETVVRDPGPSTSSLSLAPPPPLFNPPISPAPMPPDARSEASGPLFQPPTRSPTSKGRAAPTPAATVTGRKHIVAPQDNLYQISMKYFKNGSKVDAIFEANRDIMKNKGDLRPGMELKIP